jgi:hypothetical protein
MARNRMCQRVLQSVSGVLVRVVRGSVEVMKIMSWNIRGLGGFEKRKEVRSLMGEKNPDVLC